MPNNQEKSNRKKAINGLLNKKISSRRELMAIKRKLAKKYGIGILANSEILNEYKNRLLAGTMVDSQKLMRILRKRSVRTISGIASITAATEPYPCPGQCLYCPDEKGMPKSYLSNEPAIMRAIRCGFDPYKQVRERLKALEANGHEPTKIELIVIGGTWSVLPDAYKYWYVERCFAAANDYGKKISNFEFRISNQILNHNYEIKNYIFNKNLKLKIQNLKQRLLREQKKNESAKYRIIGITFGTRPDYINESELWQMRELGGTRVEIGIQAVDDKILKQNKRGHGVAEIARATKLLKDYGFKITYHIMPGLLGSNPVKDLAMFKKLFIDDRFQPDQLKIYPTVVTRGSKLYQMWRSGKYKPYSDKVLQNLLISCKEIVPPYVRIIRLIRDIPAGSIVAGNKITNLRQIMKDRGVKCRCIRCREAGEGKLEIRSKKLEAIKYRASGGIEYFIQVTDKKADKLYGFCRLRLGDKTSPTLLLKEGKIQTAPLACPAPAVVKGGRGVFVDTAIIRELHVYGELVPVGGDKKTQNAGLGKMLMKKAEEIARENGFKRIAVISGVGVRGYYRKLGYKLKNSYMVKNLV